MILCTLVNYLIFYLIWSSQVTILNWAWHHKFETAIFYNVFKSSIKTFWLCNNLWIIIKLIMCSDENYFMRVEITTKRIFEAQYSMSMTLSYAHNFLKCSLVLVFHSNERSYSISRNNYLFKPFENWKYIGCIFCNRHKIRMYRNVLIVNYYNWVNYQHWTFFWNWIHTVDSMFLNWWFDMQTFRSMPCG